jgi:hypothetical protein
MAALAVLLVQGGCFWSGRADLNRGPPAPKAGALPGCATPRLLDYKRELCRCWASVWSTQFEKTQKNRATAGNHPDAQ